MAGSIGTSAGAGGLASLRTAVFVEFAEVALEVSADRGLNPVEQHAEDVGTLTVQLAVQPLEHATGVGLCPANEHHCIDMARQQLGIRGQQRRRGVDDQQVVFCFELGQQVAEPRALEEFDGGVPGVAGGKQG